jgi:phycocyanobilin:ferredoxin oxidoreductase
MDLSNFHPVIAQLAEDLTRIWTNHLSLSPYEMPEDFGFVEGKLEGERLTIHNTCYQTEHFRKIHLELAQVGNNLDILHCVMFPRPNYGLPLFGCDLVGGRGRINAAIVDLSPTLPFTPEYVSCLTALQAQYDQFSDRRALPEWGDIFSPYCLFTRLSNPAEEQLFLAIAGAMVKQHCSIGQTLEPVVGDRQTLVHRQQQRYCQQQQQNDKTRRILEKAFGVDWAERYMTEVLFDV